MQALPICEKPCHSVRLFVNEPRKHTPFFKRSQHFHIVAEGSLHMRCASWALVALLTGGFLLLQSFSPFAKSSQTKDQSTPQKSAGLSPQKKAEALGIKFEKLEP